MAKPPPLAAITRYVKEHLHFLADQRRWRLKPSVLRSIAVNVEVLWHQPPQTHLLLKLGEDLLFYLPLSLSPARLNTMEEAREVELEQDRWYLYDPFRDSVSLQSLLRSALVGNAGRLTLELPPMGRFASATRNPLAHLREARVQNLLDEEGEPTSNYLYRLALRSDTGRADCVLKRYLPRDRPQAGEREWSLSTTLSSELVPRPLGRLTDARTMLTLGGFYELVEGREVGEIIWRLMERLAVDPLESVTSRLRMVYAKALRNLGSFYSQLGTRLGDAVPAVKVLETSLEKARQDFHTVRGFNPDAGAFERILAKLHGYVEQGAFYPPRPIHGDLMWRQILWRDAPRPIPPAQPEEVPGRLTLLDTESWRWGFLEEDLAGLAAANDFMLRRLGQSAYAPAVFSALWHAACGQLQGLEAGFELRDVKPLLCLVRLRHLHDAAYYAQARSRELARREEYELFVRNSLAMAGLSRKEHDGP